MTDVKIGNVERDEVFFKAFDERWPKFKWMLEKYCFNRIAVVEILRESKKKNQIISYLSHVWLMCLPDDINIKNNQPGIDDLLFIIDNDDFIL